MMFFSDSSETKMKYSINLMWIMLKKDNSLPFISPDQEPKKFLTTVLEPAIKWARANPNGKVTLWYDSGLTSKQAVENSQKLLNEQLSAEMISNVILSDIQTIPIVQKNPDIFSSQMNIYFKVDLLKLIILVHSLENNLNTATVFSDLEVGDLRSQKDRMSYEELFDKDTMSSLKMTGFVAGSYHSKPENQFFQAYNNPLMLDALRLVINTCMARAVYMLNNNLKIADNLRESVYANMFLDLQLFYDSVTHGGIVDGNLAEAGYKLWGLTVYPNGVACRERYDIYKNMYPESENEPKFQVCYRDISSQCRKGNAHWSLKTPIIPPTNGKTYECVYVDYTTEKALTTLGLLPDKRLSSKFPM